MLSDAQFNRLSRGLVLPRKSEDHRQKARAPFTAAIKIYPIVGKGNFESSILVRCRDVSASGVAFLCHQCYGKGANLLMKFPGATAERPLNVIGSVVRTERLTPILFLIAVRFDAVPSEDPVAPHVPAKAPVHEPPAVFASVAGPAAELKSHVAETSELPAFDEPNVQITNPIEPPVDDELARIRAAVLL